MARNPAVFTLAYGTGLNVASSGYANANLSNSGERVLLRSATGQTIQDFTYSDTHPWPSSADGDGPSLEIVDPLGDPANPANWRASFYPGGSPGGASESLSGDYDRNRVVDAADYPLWRASFGLAVEPGSGADGSADGAIDAADFVLWRHQTGASLDHAAAASGSAYVAEVGHPTIAVVAEIHDEALSVLVDPLDRTDRDARRFSPTRRGRQFSTTVHGVTVDRTQQLLFDLAHSETAEYQDGPLRSKLVTSEPFDADARDWDTFFGMVGAESLRMP